MTVTEAFDLFKSNLELPDNKQREASLAQQEVRRRLSSHLYIPNSFLTGSYARHTKIHPLNDIDVMFVRNDHRVLVSTDGAGIQPFQALDQVVSAAQQSYPQAKVTRQSRSVNLDMQAHNFGFDLIPAWLRNPTGYWIPDLDRNTWIPTNPEAHDQRLTDANERCGRMLIPLIKMAKHWSRNNLDLLRSFHLELICAAIFLSRQPVNFQHGIGLFLYHLSSFVDVPMMDPIYGSSRVDEELSGDRRSHLLRRVTYDSDNSVAALRFEKAGTSGDAIEAWKRIFVQGFPR